MMKRFLAYFLVFLLPLFAFSPSLKGDFFFDDLPAIVNNPDMQTSANWTDAFYHDFWGDPIDGKNSHKSYRPLTILSFKLISTQETAFPIHLANLILHSVNSCLVLLASRHFMAKNEDALNVALIFALHPVHTESVAGCVGLADLLYTMIVLICLTVYIRSGISVTTLMVMMILSSMAVLFKEQGIMTVPIVLSLDVIRNLKHLVRWRKAKKFLLKICACFLYLSTVIYARLWIMRFTSPKFQEQDNPAAFMESRLLRVLNHSYHYAINVWLMLCPDWLCFDWAMGCLSLITKLTDFRLIFVIALLASPVFFLWTIFKSGVKQESKMVLAGLALTVLPFLPSSNIFFTVGFVIAERNLYLSIFGFAIITSIGMSKVKKYYHSNNAVVAVIKLSFLFLLVCFFFKSNLRSRDWLSQDSLFRSGLKVCPRNAKVHYNIAKVSADQGQRDLAIQEYEIAIGLHPKYEQALNNLGNILKHQNRLLEAKNLLQRAVEANAEFSSAWMNLGIVLASLGEFSESEYSYLQALMHRKRYADCHYNLGNLYLKLQRHQKAMDSFSKAIEQNPNHKLAWSNLVNLLDDIGKFELAESKAKDAIELFPEAPEFHFHLANVYGKLEKFNDAEESYLRAILLKETSLYYGNLGVLYHRWKKYEKAIENYEKALLLDENNFSAKRNMESLVSKIKV